MKVIPLSMKSSSDRERRTISNKTGPGSGIQNQSKKINCRMKIIIITIAIILIIAILILLIKIFVFNKDNGEESNQSDKKKIDCPIGFFLPEDDNLKCHECQINNCKECKGNKINNLCIVWKEGYEPEYNDKNEIIDCKEIKCGDNCLTCNPSDKSCTNCKPGYFIPNDSENNSNCEKCSLENCEKCEGEKNNNNCILCKNEFFTKKGQDNKIQSCNKKCQIGNDEKCKECDNQNNICLVCKDGYYIPTNDELKLGCKSCSLNNCKTCHGTKNEDICEVCEEGYEPEIENGKIKKCKINNCEIGEKEKCLTCSGIENECGSCNPSYILVDGKCETSFTFNAKYSILNPNDYVQIIDKSKIPYIKNIYVDGESRNKNEVNSNGNFKFETTGEHIVEMLLEINNDIFYELFRDCKNLISVQFNTIKNDIDNNIKITSMQGIFKNCEKLTSIDISKIETKYVENISYMVYGCSKLTSIDFSNNNFENVVNASGIFAYDDSLTNANLGSFQSLEFFDHAFYGSLMTSIDISLLNTYNLKDITSLFYNCISLKSLNFNNNFYTEQIINMQFLFYNCSSLISLDLPSFDTKNVRNMSYMFHNCTLLASININNFDTRNVINMEAMFNNCSSLTSIDLTKFNTENVENMAFMFSNCFALTKVDLSKFKTNKVNNMLAMFKNCQSLTSIDISNFDTSQVTDFENMFLNCKSLTSLDISNFNFEKWEFITFNKIGYRCISFMIHYCESLTYLDISSVKLVKDGFFEGLPSNGIIKCRKELKDNIKNKNYLPDWEWIIIE